MNPALAARVASAVSRHLFVGVEVRAPAGAGFGPWRTVQGQDRRGFTDQSPQGFDTGMRVPTHVIHLLASDFPDGLPGVGWQVRLNGSAIYRISEPAAAWDAAGQFVTAPLVAV